MLPRFLLTFVALALVPAAVHAQIALERAPNPDPETVYSALPNGAFLENVVFRRVYKRANPRKGAIVVTLPSGGATTGVVVYTENGQLIARHPAFGKIALAGFTPEDLRTNGPQIEEAVRALYAQGVQPPTISSATTEDQLARGYELLHDWSDFPSARTEAPFTVAGSDGSSVVYPPGSVVFDWNGTHWFWHPDLGVRGQPIPLDPVTGQPYLCVKYGDVVESIAFYYAYLRIHPEEKATLLAPMPPLHSGPPRQGDLSSLTWAAVAYTKHDKLWLRSHILGDVPLDQFTPADLKKTDALHSAYKQLLREKLKTRRQGTGNSSDLPPTIHRVAAELGTVMPSSLPGDDEDMQLRRVFLALKNLNGNAGVRWVDEVAPDGVDTDHFLMLSCEDKAFQYSSGSPTVHRRFRDRDEPSGLVSGLLYNLAWQKDHPKEKTALIFPLVGGSTNATALQSLAGQTRYYHYTIGSFVLPSVKPEDWTDPLKRPEILVAARKTLDEQHAQEWASRQKISADQLAREVEEGRKFEVAHVYQVFHDAGLVCSIVNERDWGEDGHFTEYPVPTLIFAWDGATYTYNAMHQCVRTAGYFPFRMRLE